MLMCAIVYLGEIRGQLVKIASPTMWVLREHTQLGRMLAVAQLAEFLCQLSTRSCGDPLGILIALISTFHVLLLKEIKISMKEIHSIMPRYNTSDVHHRCPK